MKDGDYVEAKTLTELGERPRKLTGTLQIVEAEGDDIYPPFKAYFVDGKEADEGTIKTIKNINASSLAIYEFYNQCHDPETGRFCENDITNDGLSSFPEARKAAILRTTARLQNSWGVTAHIDARPSQKGQHQNFAEETGALAAVAPWEPGVIHVNPKLANDQWAKNQLSRKTFIAKSVGDVIIHEYGHILEGELEETKDWDTVHELRGKFTEVIGDDSWDSRQARNQLRMDISYYAGESDHEAVAESFLAYVKEIKNQWSDHVGTVLNKKFKKGGSR